MHLFKVKKWLSCRYSKPHPHFTDLTFIFDKKKWGVAYTPVLTECHVLQPCQVWHCKKSLTSLLQTKKASQQFCTLGVSIYICWSCLPSSDKQSRYQTQQHWYVSCPRHVDWYSTQLRYIKNVNSIEEEIKKTRHNIKTKEQNF